MNSLVCIDTNLLIDVLGDRDRSKKVLEVLAEHSVCVTTHTVVTAYYHARKYSGFNNESYNTFISAFRILKVNADVLNRAFRLAGKKGDLEDAIQIEACKLANVKTFVTADKELAERYQHEIHIESVE